MAMLPVSVSLDEVMAAREARAMKIKSLLKEYSCPVVCMTMNMVGDIKVTGLSRAAFSVMSERLKGALSPLSSFTNLSPCGDEAYFAVNMPPERVKAIACAFENTEHIGRVLDIDVFDLNGEKLSRGEPRKCLICGELAMVCSRSRAHGVETVRTATNDRFCRFLASVIAQYAHEALLAEVDATPKPGLVDRLNSGAHSDMDLNLFYKSSNSLYGYFRDVAYHAFTRSDTDGLMAELRLFGIEAERDMLEVTGGVNTHKGAIYSMGLLCAAVALVLKRGGSYDEITDTAARLVSSENEKISDNTNGRAVYKKYGKQGARGEAKSGFPTVVYAVNALRKYGELDKNTASVFALIDIMTVLDDTNVLHRAGDEGLSYMRSRAKATCELPYDERMAASFDMDRCFIERNISPGGCADMLSAALFLREAERLFRKMQ